MEEVWHIKKNGSMTPISPSQHEIPRKKKRTYYAKVNTSGLEEEELITSPSFKL